MRASEILKEHIVNVFDPFLMERFCEEVFHLIATAYAGIGGHANFQCPTDLLDSDYWKLVRRNGVIVAACIYKSSNGRKRIAIGHDGSREAKDELRKIFREDVQHRRVWAEVSGASARFAISLGYPPIPNDVVEALLKKPIFAKHGRFKYDRLIAGHVHTKIMVGFPNSQSYGVSEFDLDEVLF